LLNQTPTPEKKSRKKIWIAVAIIAVIVIAFITVGIANYSSNNNINNNNTSTPPAMVDVTAVDLTIQYTGITSGYLGPTSQSLNGFTVTASNQFTYTITFTTSAVLLTHSINAIYVNTPGFSIVSISPNLPYSFGPGSTVTITITMTAPSSSYTGVLNLVVSTS